MNQRSLDDAQQVCPDLWKIQNLFFPNELAEILDRLSQEKKWKTVDLQDYRPREELEWETDGLCDWIWCKLKELDFSKFNLLLRTAVVWKDSAGYIIRNHVDNDRVVAAMQIYLSPTYFELGTWFDDTEEIPFIQNTGYLMHNRNKLIHGMKNAVPVGYTRFSLYVLFDENPR